MFVLFVYKKKRITDRVPGLAMLDGRGVDTIVKCFSPSDMVKVGCWV